jgi:hypothetical protein
MLTTTVLWVVNNKQKAKPYETLMYWAGAITLVIFVGAIWGWPILNFLSSLNAMPRDIGLIIALLTIMLGWYVMRSGSKDIDALRDTHKHLQDDVMRTFNWRRELRQNNIIRAQAKLVAAFVGLLFILAITGFGPDLVRTTWVGSQVTWRDAVTKAGGSLAVALAIFGWIFTAIKNWPINAENRNGDKPSR